MHVTQRATYENASRGPGSSGTGRIAGWAGPFDERTAGIYIWSAAYGVRRASYDVQRPTRASITTDQPDPSTTAMKVSAPVCALSSTSLVWPPEDRQFVFHPFG